MIISKTYYVVISEVQSDEYGYVCPVYFDLKKLQEDYPGCEYIEVESGYFEINLN